MRRPDSQDGCVTMSAVSRSEHFSPATFRQAAEKNRLVACAPRKKCNSGILPESIEQASSAVVFRKQDACADRTARMAVLLSDLSRSEPGFTSNFSAGCRKEQAGSLCSPEKSVTQASCLNPSSRLPACSFAASRMVAQTGQPGWLCYAVSSAQAPPECPFASALREPGMTTCRQPQRPQPGCQV